ncbi:MAG: pentapeptide repeat-containing protein [Zoogloea sp.]|nr:pentapeptide repeat-containing protein [Zoogloea sp.]
MRRQAIRVSLPGTYFDSANLDAARFCGADLSKASMRDAMVWETDFTNADLTGADFRGALLGDPIFSQADISRAWFGWLADQSHVDLSHARGTPEWAPMNP